MGVRIGCGLNGGGGGVVYVFVCTYILWLCRA